MGDVSFEKLFILGLVALFIISPERLPAAAGWLGHNMGKVKAFTAATTDQLRRELHQPLAELRAPHQQLRGLRDPRALVMRHILSEPPPATAGASTETITYPSRHSRHQLRQAQQGTPSRRVPPGRQPNPTADSSPRCGTH
jgi:sec-independent protein translocase protein TatB